jgi:RNase P/RNase MRP subunit p30
MFQPSAPSINRMLARAATAMVTAIRFGLRALRRTWGPARDRAFRRFERRLLDDFHWQR